MTNKKIARQIAILQDTLRTASAELGPVKVAALAAELADLQAQVNEAIPVPAGTPYFAPIPVRIPCHNELPVIDVVPTLTVTPGAQAVIEKIAADLAATRQEPIDLDSDTQPCQDEIVAPAPAGDVSGPVSVEFLLAGDAIFTVGNPEGVRYTFKVSRPDTRYYGEYFVAMLTGPNNNSDYTYIGMLHAETFAFRLTKGSKVTADSLPVKVFTFAITRIRGLKPIPAGYTILHEGKCGRCGLRLTVTESIQRGLGPECAGLQPGELSKSQKKRRSKKAAA